VCNRNTKVLGWAMDKEKSGWAMEDCEHGRKIIDLLDKADMEQYNKEFASKQSDKN
jgi:hypothetical protein